jgi:hypothetical protein
VHILVYFRHHAVLIKNLPGGGGLLEGFALKAGMQPVVAPNGRDFVIAEEPVGLLVARDAVFAEHRPLGEVFIPIPELHVETAILRLVMHLPVTSGHHFR